MEGAHFFAFLRRMRFIKRWGLMRNTQEENIQEHSLETAFIAHNLACLRNTYYGGQVDANRIAVLAMYHEVSEIFTGDMPTPIKYFDATLRRLYGKVELLAQQKMLSTLPEKLQATYKPFIMGDGTPEEKQLVKAADNLAAHLKCVAEKNAGNDEFNEAYEATLDKLNDLAQTIPEVKLFMELYVPSFSCSLDRLNYTMIPHKEGVGKDA